MRSWIRIIARGPIAAQPTRIESLTAGYFYLSRLLEDWGYQAVVRTDIVKHHLEEMGGSYFRIAHIQDKVTSLIQEKLEQFMERHAAGLIPGRVRLTNVGLPWNRMFEVAFELESSPHPADG